MPPGGCPGAPAYYGRIWRCPGPAGLYKGGLVLYYGGCLFVLQPALGESPTHFTLFLQQLLERDRGGMGIRVVIDENRDRVMFV